MRKTLAMGIAAALLSIGPAYAEGQVATDSSLELRVEQLSRSIRLAELPAQTTRPQVYEKEWQRRLLAVQVQYASTLPDRSHTGSITRPAQ